MLSKNKIKYIHSLELKKTRKEEQVFLAEGPKLTGDLLGHFPCRFLAATSSWLQAHPDIQANDPQGENGPAIQVYNVTGVPHCILLDKEGKIFKTNMRGAYLDAALEQLIP